jgi:acyl carrier protein
MAVAGNWTPCTTELIRPKCQVALISCNHAAYRYVSAMLALSSMPPVASLPPPAASFFLESRDGQIHAIYHGRSDGAAPRAHYLYIHPLCWRDERLAAPLDDVRARAGPRWGWCSEVARTPLFVDDRLAGGVVVGLHGKQEAMTEAIATTLKEVLRRHLPLVSAGDPIPMDEELVDLGIDSMGLVELVLDIERAFGVVISDDMLSEENFRSAASLTGLLTLLCEEQGGFQRSP